jgi:alpha-beta hydrolase superfamily lysophospholipase
MMGTDGSSSGGMFDARGASAVEARGVNTAAPARVLMKDGYFEHSRGLRAYECEFVLEQPHPSRGSLIVLMHGYGEHCRRYDELSQYLARRGHVVCLFDARGHGRSQGQRGHVRDFAEYVDDFAAFVARVRPRLDFRPLIVLGHSNGGLIAIRAIQLGLAGVRALVLTGPLLGLRKSRQAAPDAVARVLSAIAPRLPLPNGIRSEDLTHDPAARDAHRHDPWVHRLATPRWYWSMTVAGRDALLGAQRVTLPLLIVQGEHDPIVEPLRVAEFYERAGSRDKRLVQRPGELHEVLNETARRESFELIAAWIEGACSEVSAPDAG